MYTPKLREDLVCALYRLKQVKKKPMTKLLNQAVEQYLYSNQTNMSDASELSDNRTRIMTSSLKKSA
ncbi:MAG: hypothetical protein K8F60_12735 [Melioribacteraceae bacterium]|nr:hypothetical protein [Melioribacteraceae bacterium]